jgi:glutamyl-tRNA reductase
MTQAKAIQEVNIVEVIKSVGKKNKRIQAKILQELEKHLDKSSPEYEELRKFILDEVNGYTRSIMRDIFGDIEYMIQG